LPPIEISTSPGSTTLLNCSSIRDNCLGVNVNDTERVSPGFRLTRLKPASERNGAQAGAPRCFKYTSTTSSAETLPVFLTLTDNDRLSPVFVSFGAVSPEYAKVE